MEQIFEIPLVVLNQAGKAIYPPALAGSAVDALPAIYAQLFNSAKETGISLDPMRGISAIMLAVGEERLLICARLVNEAFVEEMENLREQNRELAVMVESSIDGFTIADGEGRILWVNHSYSQIAGVPAERFIGKTVYELMEEGIFSASATQLALERKKPSTINQLFRDGTKQTLNTSNPVFNADGSLYRIVTNVRDMSEVHNLRAELAESKALLDQYTHLLEKMMSLQARQGYHTTNNSLMRNMYIRAMEYAGAYAPVLITGESGVGKEVVADFIHGNSARQNKPFLKINCGALPEQLLEAELFGYEAGAFTGARKQGRMGLFEVADGGTVFLDEVGELPLGIQVKLLRFVQNREFYRLGGNKLHTVDVRIIAATNRDLEEMVLERSFRADLFYRLNVLSLSVPPLRERDEDIVPLAEHFLKKFCDQYSQQKYLTQKTCELLAAYAWPGNIRELANLIERLTIVGADNAITPGHLPDYIREPNAGAVVAEYGMYRESLEAFEKDYWSTMLKRYKSYRQAASALGVDHSTIVKKVARYKLDNPLR